MQAPGPLVAKCVHLAVAAPAVYPGAEAIVGDTTDSGRIGAAASSPTR